MLTQVEINSNIQTDFLRLPQASGSSTFCLYDAPVRFLSTKGRTFCPFTVTSNQCTANSNSYLNANRYIQKIISNVNQNEIPLNIEYFTCRYASASGGGSTGGTTTSFNCNSGNCQFSSSARLFDNSINICATTWSSPVATVNVPLDYYQTPDSSSCTSTTLPTISSKNRVFLKILFYAIQISLYIN